MSNKHVVGLASAGDHLPFGLAIGELDGVQPQNSRRTE
jgi:hypothetical protein